MQLNNLATICSIGSLNLIQLRDLFFSCVVNNLGNCVVWIKYCHLSWGMKWCVYLFIYDVIHVYPHMHDVSVICVMYYWCLSVLLDTRATQVKLFVVPLFKTLYSNLWKSYVLPGSEKTLVILLSENYQEVCFSHQLLLPNVNSIQKFHILYFQNCDICWRGW